MKKAELLKHSTCDVCNRSIGACGLPLFWRVTIERFGIDLRAVRRQDGLAQFMGNSVLADVMGPDEDLALPVLDAPKVATVCEECALNKPVPIGVLGLT